MVLVSVMKDSPINITFRKQLPVTKLVKARKNAARYLTSPMVWILARTAITPNTITWFGFLLSAGAVALIITEHLLAAGFTVLTAGLCDMLDGALARVTNRTTHFGAILDSVLDRVSEAVVLLGILILYARAQFLPGVILAGITLPGSLLVSYVRARAEAAGLECEVGLFTRAERVIILALGLLMNQIDYALVTAVGVIALFSLLTTAQRLFHARRQTRPDQGITTPELKL
ncbi:MAG: CDP-alcohol phosphatidyltransferase family protein [Dehalococcoidales bacterium]|jgi:CDP-diacylglycerol--glycerol-3-phosphate 3-phosphatidyltransferase|nr:CDP-alcohol phosphatidyltransferase family protein [Dehalococcoidales bacterium]